MKIPEHVTDVNGTPAGLVSRWTEAIFSLASFACMASMASKICRRRGQASGGGHCHRDSWYVGGREAQKAPFLPPSLLMSPVREGAMFSPWALRLFQSKPSEDERYDGNGKASVGNATIQEFMITDNDTLNVACRKILVTRHSMCASSGLLCNSTMY